jgi:glycosyltransferase involved in cell wall biosynthesis
VIPSNTTSVGKAPLAVLVPRLRVGGADAYMRDALAHVIDPEDGSKVLLYVIHPSEHEQMSFSGMNTVPVRRSLSINQRLSFIEKDMVRRGVGVVLTQLVSLNVLRTLWTSQIRTAIIFHNDELTWSYSPASLASAHVPLLITSCIALADRLSPLAPEIPIRVIRPMHDVISGTVCRNKLRQEWDIPEQAFLIGMIGTFKLHKRYTQAVRILHCLRTKGVDAYLVIVGGHSETYGGGEQAYHATLGLSALLGVSDFIRCPGELVDPGDLYQAFDVFLNTSLYEGLSRATITAAAQGCPIVTTDVGGQSEILVEGDRPVASYASTEEMTNAVLSCGSAVRPTRERSGHGVVTRCQWQSVWHTLRSLVAERPARAGALRAPKRLLELDDVVPSLSSLVRQGAHSSQIDFDSMCNQVLALVATLLERGHSQNVNLEASQRVAKVLLVELLQGTTISWHDATPLSETEFKQIVPSSLSTALGLPFTRYRDLVTNANAFSSSLQQRGAYASS